MDLFTVYLLEWVPKLPSTELNSLYWIRVRISFFHLLNTNTNAYYYSVPLKDNDNNS